MIVKHYLAVADRPAEGAPWSIVLPSYPGLTAATAEFREIPREAAAALATALRQMQNAGETPPPTIEDGGPGPDEYKLDGFHKPRSFLIPVATAPSGPDPAHPTEIGGPEGPEPTRFGDWEKGGRCTDF